MAKRFDKQNSRLLDLMGHTKCLDDLLSFELQEPQELIDMRALVERSKVDGATATPEEKAQFERFKNFDYPAYNKQAKAFFDVNRVGVLLKLEADYDVLCDEYPDFEKHIDTLALKFDPPLIIYQLVHPT